MKKIFDVVKMIFGTVWEVIKMINRSLSDSLNLEYWILPTIFVIVIIAAIIIIRVKRKIN